MFLKTKIILTGKQLLIGIPKTIYRFFEYLSEWMRFSRKNDKRFTVKARDAYPCIADKLKTTPFDAHYTYHPAWAARILSKTRPTEHVDISSILHFSTILSAFIPTRFYDYRPAMLSLPGYSSGFADLTNLPFEDGSIESLSCMHTIEHIGLGRYGDPVDPEGDLAAIKELKRVLKKGGSLLFVTPVGMPKIEFNAHRIYSYEMIAGLFAPLEIMEFSMVNDKNEFIINADPETVREQQYACGCFWFKK